MAQACSNLISNAIEHGRPDSPVRISIEGGAGELVFQVQNDADVIPPAKLRTFFDPVKRFAIGSAHERGEAGTANLGLGLYVVKEIVKAHQGSVSVTSSEAEGVRFVVKLPRRTPHRRGGD
ncbi:sensor histidine kinase [Massilia jejuensis]|uniref:histidine kinase n=1 Tax=Massilia jejuensis TaxID=648894 RepID=A0ABW0PKV0_9BURK